MKRILRWRSCVPRNRVLNVVCVNVTRAKEGVIHTHDFAEVFWVTQGLGLHLINRRERPLRIGALCLIRPWRDKHMLRAVTPDFTLYNVAFPAEVLHDLKKRYFHTEPFWGGHGIEPAVFYLDETERQWLSATGQELCRAPQNRLILDRFLLNLLCITGQGRPDPFRACPDWLHRACELIREPEHFIHGTQGFAKLCNRTPEHVARTLMKFAGQNPGAVVNSARIEYAAGQLLTTSKDIQAISLDCGFSSLSYFYKLFHQTFGISPRHYRLEHFKAPTRLLFAGFPASPQKERLFPATRPIRQNDKSPAADTGSHNDISGG